MGILASSPKVQEKTPPPSAKRRSMQADFAKLKPLDPSSLLGFSKFRDPSDRSPKSSGNTNDADKKRRNDDSDEDIYFKDETLEDGESKTGVAMLSPEDARRQGELAEGVQKIRVSSH